MYIVTGGAGFIGSNIVAALCAAGEEVVVCDWMRADFRWRNLAKHNIADLITPAELLPFVERQESRISAVIHMGAISDTTETDVGHIVQNNIRSTLDILSWCSSTNTRFIYASSAATYGDGSAGFDDDASPEGLAKLKPLNAYGWSKHVVDRRISYLRATQRGLPRQCVGLKFFNVYGPNEYHKGHMQSVIARNYAKIMSGDRIRLFRSDNAHYKDGEQLRDFIYVEDCVRVVAWLLENEHVSGLFNVGTGAARSWLDLARALFAAAKRPVAVEFIDMPQDLKRKYQYFTQASTGKLSAAGYAKLPTTLEAGVADYVQNYLSADDPHR